MDAYGCLWSPVRSRCFFAGNIAALTVRLHQVVVSGKSVSHRQASFSLAVWPCSRMQQVSSSLWPDFQQIFGWFLIPIWLRRLVQTRSGFKQWEKARCFSMFFLLLFVFVSPFRFLWIRFPSIPLGQAQASYPWGTCQIQMMRTARRSRARLKWIEYVGRWMADVGVWSREEQSSHPWYCTPWFLITNVCCRPVSSPKHPKTKANYI